MTHTELYEIVKDHRDVWGEHLFPEIHKAHGVIWWANRAMGGTPVPAALVEPTLLGLGVAWLAQNGACPSLYGNALNSKSRIDYTVKYADGTPGLYFKYADSPTAAVYAAIGEVKAARRGSA